MNDALDPRKLIAEAVGTFTLIFAGVASIMMGSATASANLVSVALAHGLAIGLMVVALGHISGGHFNPAVTIGFWVTRRIESVQGIAYIVSQLAGAILGALALLVLFPEGLRNATDLGTPQLGAGVELAQGIGIEAILTFFLVTVIWGSAVGQVTPKLAGLGIGLTVAMDVMAGGPMTGAAMNPARALGPALVNGTWDDHIVYWVGPIIGAIAAALLAHYVFEHDAEEAAE